MENLPKAVTPLALDSQLLYIYGIIVTTVVIKHGLYYFTCRFVNLLLNIKNEDSLHLNS